MTTTRTPAAPTDPFTVSRHLIEEHGARREVVDRRNVTGDDLRAMHEREHRARWPWQHKRPHEHGRRSG